MKACKKASVKTRKQTPKQLANLRPPWKPGECPNPGGRPKGSGITRWYIPVLNEIDPKTHKEKAEQLARAHIERAMDNPSFANIVLDRTEGRVVEKVEVSVLENLADEIAEARKRAASKEK